MDSEGFYDRNDPRTAPQMFRDAMRQISNQDRLAEMDRRKEYIPPDAIDGKDDK